MTSASVNFGNFSALNIPQDDREMIESGFKAVSSVDGGWTVLAREDVPGRRACLYCGEAFERRPTCKICEGEGTVERSFMFDAGQHPDPDVAKTIGLITQAVSDGYGGHSGASFGMTMRILERIAKDGWDAYAKRMLKNYGPPPPESMEEKRKRFLALPTNMSLGEQVKAIEEFKDVPMTYAEMRERFG